MISSLRRAASLLHQFAEAVVALLMAVIFGAFMIGIILRYATDLPSGWTAELSLAAWVWLVLWGASFVLKDHEEIRFDLVTNLVGRRARIAMSLASSLAIIAVFAMSLPAAWSYVSFMKVESTSYLKIRFDWLFSIYLIFSFAVIARNLWSLGKLLRGKDPIHSMNPFPAEPSE